jgi:hypothetical protein
VLALLCGSRGQGRGKPAQQTILSTALPFKVMEMAMPLISLADDPLVGPQLDITAPDHGVEVKYDGRVLWVNVDGVCRLRVCRMPNPVTFDEELKGGETGEKLQR